MRPNTRRQVLFLGAGVLLLGRGVAHAHHGWGGYDATNPLDLTGRIERMSYDNPHAMLWLATENKTWEVVLAPPSRMRSRGVTAEMIEGGTEIEAYGYPHRSREVELRAEWLKIAGTTYQLR